MDFFSLIIFVFHPSLVLSMSLKYRNHKIMNNVLQRNKLWLYYNLYSSSVFGT